MKVLIIDSKLNYSLSGGGIYNSLIYNEALKYKNVDILTDDNIGKSNVPLFYNIIYLLNIKKIINHDCIILGSSLYPRTVIFLLFLKLIKRKINIITIHHHFAFYSKPNFIVRIFSKVLEILFLKLCTEIIVPSEYTLDLSKKFLKRAKLTYIPLGFDTTIKPRNHETTKSDFIKLLFVGSICHRKGLSYLIDACSELKDQYQLNIVGSYREEDKYFKNLISKIDKYGLSEQIKIVGRVTDIALEAYYKGSDIFVFPSLYEGFGMVIAEAFIHGLPVVAFRNSAIPYNVKNGYNGILVENKSIHGLSSALDTLSGDKEVYKELSENAKKTAEKLNKYDNMIEDMNNWIHNKMAVQK